MGKAVMVGALMVSVVAGCVKDGDEEGKEVVVGDGLPDFEVVMNDGSVVTDEGLKGSVSVVMFFYTPCPDCRVALPRVQGIYDDYAQKGVKFVLIGREESAEDVASYWKENSFKMPYSVQNDREVYEKFVKTGIPRIYINDKDGIIRYVFTDNPVPEYDELKSALDTLL